MALVDDPAVRLAKLGTAELDWSRIEGYFGGRSQNACRKKYWQLTKKQDSDSEAFELTGGRHRAGQLRREV